ncbi:MAG: glucosamine-6-phosphate deaminase [Clostridia bacterium]|nr:glucosamine-6-phosphate deaminase [Clostridia bacterium]
MKVIVVENYQQIGQLGAQIIADVIKNNPNAVLGLATGTSPIGIYQNLVEMCQKGEISFANVKTVNLDEYVGLDGTHPQSYRYFMNDNLFNHVDIDKANTFVPNGVAENLQEECARYTTLVNNLVQDIQLLGIGSNGHIAFNEPGTPFESTTHMVNLTENTIKDNSRLFDDISQVPTKALTMGIANIMNAKRILIVANGKNKAQAVYDMVKGQVNTTCPASVLQNHPDVTVVVDKDAASLL